MPAKSISLIEAAHQLAVPWHTAHRYALTGRLDARKANDRWTVTVSSLKKLAKELRAERSN